MNRKVRESLLKKYGVFDNTQDLAICKELLEAYQKSEREFGIDSSNQQMKVNQVKRYPFAYNAYNLDQDKPNEVNK
jgi:hypothetical protein